VDPSELLVSNDHADSGEKLTEIEKTRRDLMIARLESFKREAAQQAKTESTIPTPPATPPKKTKPRQLPPRPPTTLPPENDSKTAASDSFITRSATPRPDRKPPETALAPPKPTPNKSVTPEKSPEHTKLISSDAAESSNERPTWRIKPKVEADDQTPINNNLSSGIEQIVNKKPSKPQVTLPYSEVPPKITPATNFKDHHDPPKTPKIIKIPPIDRGRYYPKSSDRYNHYDQYHRNRDKLIDDIMFGIVNADIAARRHQMAQPQAKTTKKET